MKKILNISLNIIFFVTLFTSCSIQEEVLFQKDFSGTYKYKLDLSEMMQSLGGGAEELPLEEFNSPERAKELAEALGLNTATIGMDKEGILKITFDFKNLDELNQAYSRLQGTMSQAMGAGAGNDMSQLKNIETYEYFQRKGKKLTFTKPIKSMEENEELPIDMEEMQGMLEQMEDALKAEMIIKFENRKIKKIQPSNMNVEQKENAITIITDLNKTLNSEKNTQQETPKVTIKLK